MSKIFAREIILTAARAGYTFVVSCDGVVDYRGDQPLKAWEAVEACSDAMRVTIRKEGERTESMIVCAYDLSPEETVIDYSSDGFIDVEWNKLFKEAG